MTQDIIGIDVTVEFSDGEKVQGHISPVGVHMNSRQDNPERIRTILGAMRDSIADRLKPYKSQR